jgi:predicted nucleic acid-binding Zn ribbon protein
MRSLGLDRQYDGWQVVEHWPEIVGAKMAERAAAIRFDDGTLFVAVPDDVWRHQLSMELEAILKRVQAQPYGRAVQRIRLLRGRKDMKDV